MVVTEEGLPLSYEVFEGNRADVTCAVSSSIHAPYEVQERPADGAGHPECPTLAGFVRSQVRFAALRPDQYLL